LVFPVKAKKRSEAFKMPRSKFQPFQKAKLAKLQLSVMKGHVSFKKIDLIP
jgi:hypothetical protein